MKYAVYTSYIIVYPSEFKCHQYLYVELNYFVCIIYKGNMFRIQTEVYNSGKLIVAKAFKKLPKLQ